MNPIDSFRSESSLDSPAYTLFEVDASGEIHIVTHKVGEEAWISASDFTLLLFFLTLNQAIATVVMQGPTDAIARLLLRLSPELFEKVHA